MNTKFVLFVSLLMCTLLACNSQTGPLPQSLQTPSPFDLPPTWTPSPTLNSKSIFTDVPLATYTPVPILNSRFYPNQDSISQLLQRFHETLTSPDSNWVAYRESNGIRVVNPQTEKLWTLPCALFSKCDILFPMSWSSDNQFLYFAPAAYGIGAPIGISRFTAAGRIDVISGEWEKLLQDSDHYYDFSVSADNAYMAYTQSAGNDSVTLSILNLQSRKEQRFTLDGRHGGNIVWSPFKPRFVFQLQNPAKGSSIVYFDVNENILRYVVREEQSDFYIFYWDENNLVHFQKADWADRAISDWVLDPFANELTRISPPPNP